MINAPIVSICCQTYNHVAFIEKALESFLMQETNFDFEILLRDDASTDGTAEICKKYAEKYPDKINLLAYNQNQFKKGVRPFPDNVKRAKGKYIAVCEGDDYWTDSLKLQKQVDILDENDDCILVSAGFKSIYSNGKTESYIASIDEDTSSIGFFFTLEDESKVWLTKTLTALFRNDQDVYRELSKYKVSFDTHLFYHLLKKGKGYYFKQIMGVYNRHDGGIASSLDSIRKNRVSFRIHKEMFEINQDEYCRRNFLTVSLDILNDIVSFKKGYQDIHFLQHFFVSLKLIKTKSEITMFFKCLIPVQVKNFFKA